MAHVQVHADDIALDSPVLVEGLPGAGLVGKIAADHLIEEFGMHYYGAIHCDGLPEVAVYRGESSDVLPPVRLYADQERDLLVLQSDVPVTQSANSGAPDGDTGTSLWRTRRSRASSAYSRTGGMTSEESPR